MAITRKWLLHKNQSDCQNHVNHVFFSLPIFITLSESTTKFELEHKYLENTMKVCDKLIMLFFNGNWIFMENNFISVSLLNGSSNGFPTAITLIVNNT